MKKHLLLLLGSLIVMPTLARDFDYTYEGQTITYTVLDENAKTVTTKNGSSDYRTPGNRVSGKLILPPRVYDGVIEYNLTEIGNAGFAYCSDLESVTLPKSIITIGSHAFSNCKKMKDVRLPDGLPEIKSYTFYDCKSLRHTTIQGSVTSIGDKAFYGCDSIKTFTFAPSQKELTIDGYFALSSNMDSLVINRKLPTLSGAKPKHVVIGEGVDSIAPSLFSNKTSILSVSLPSTLKIIGEKAFSECSNLESINFPSSLTDLGPSAFFRCKSLKTIVLPNSLAVIRERTFHECVALKEVKLPEYLEQIEKYAFQYSKSISHITIPGTVTNINDYAFDGCDSMKTITFERSQKDIKFGTGALCSVDSLVINRYLPSRGGSSPTHVVFGEGVDSIAPSIFSYSNIQSVSLPSTLKIIGEKAFSSCSKLESVNFSEPLTETGSTALMIGSGAFTSCSSIKSIALPKSLVTIGSSAFSDCKTLTDVVLPEGLEQIGYRAFYICKSLRRTTIPGSVTSIGGSAFQSCDSIKTFTFAPSKKEIVIDSSAALSSNMDSMVINRIIPASGSAKPKHVVIGEGVDSIVANLFNSRTSILTVNLPSTLKSIGKGAFNSCTGIDSILSEAKTPPTCGSNTFASAIYPKAVVTVPMGSRRKYAAAEVWKNFVNIRTEGAQLVTVDYDHALGEVKLNGEATDSIELNEGEPLDVALTPATGYDIESVTANGEDCTDRLDKGVLHYDEISDTLAIAVKFAPIMFDIKLPAEIKGGHIEVNGSAEAPAQLQYGSRVSLRPVADEGYLLESMSVNGTAVTLDAEGGYVIGSLTESITVDVVFDIIRFKASAKYDSAMGSVTLNGQEGETLVDYGTSLTIKATPDDGHYVGELKVNGAAVNHEQLSEPVIIGRVTEDMAVEVAFDIYTYAITATYDNALGSVSINGSEGAADVDWGTDAAVIITPAYGYQIASVELDGSDVTDEVDADGRLTIKAVKADHSLTVAFEVKRVSLSIAMEGGELMTVHDFATELRYIPIPEKGWSFHSATVGTQVITSLDNDGSFLVGPLTDDTTVSVVFTNTISAADTPGADTITVSVREHTVMIAGAADDAIAEVYDAAGLRYYSGLKRAITLDKASVYIVIITGRSFKVMLR